MQTIMKRNRLFIFVAAVAAMAACTKTADPENASNEYIVDGVRTVVFKAVMGGVATPDSKAVIDLNDKSKPQTFWENDDEITVYTSADYSGSVAMSMRGYEFSTDLVSNSTSATFTYTGDGCTSGDYLAIYPAANENRAINYTPTDGAYRMAAVDVPTNQTLVAGSFDKSAAVMTAYAPAGSSTLNFKNATALIKFQVADADIKGGSIIADGADRISGRFRADVSTASPYEPVLSEYSAPGVVEQNYVNFTLDGGASLSVGTDYYVAVRPTDLTDGFKVYLNGYLVKTISKSACASFARNKVYNLGTLTKAGAEEMVLPFDFSGTPPTVDPAWPTTYGYTHVDGGIERVYPLYGTNYSFCLADCGGAGKAQVCWYSTGLLFNAAQRYFGLPAIPGYKLTKIDCYKKSGALTAKFEIVESIVGNTSDAPADIVTGGEAQVFNENGKWFTYELSGTAANTRYYIYCKVKGTIAAITLTYEQ